MIPGVDADLKQELFNGAGAIGTIWIGEIHQLGVGRELIPFRFVTHDYLAIFSDPRYEAVDDELMLAMSQEWAEGFLPAQGSRIIKFCRADAETDFFEPNSWELPNPMQIFEFIETLADVVASHATTCPTTSQYFFWPASKSLEVAYKRAFRYLNRYCLPGQFVPILEPIGVFDGYQRT